MRRPKCSLIHSVNRIADQYFESNVTKWTNTKAKQVLVRWATSENEERVDEIALRNIVKRQ